MITRATEADDLVDAVVRFCRFLKAWGMRVHPDASLSALLALREIELDRRNDFRAALRLSLVHRPEDFPLYEHLFHTFWRTEKRELDSARSPDSSPESLGDTKRRAPTEREDDDEDSTPPPPATTRSILRSADELAVSAVEIEGVTAAPGGATPGDAEVPPVRKEEAAELERLARGLAPLLATRRSRRWARDPRGRSIDLRSAMRESLRFGGTPIELPRRSHRLTRTRLLLFCDVSRSMDEHVAFFLRFAAAVLRHLYKVEVFLFATDIVRVTPLWLRESWSNLKLRVPDCGGGTKIGQCLASFCEAYETSLLGGDTVVMIFSDGLDAGDPADLERALETIRRRARAIVWLNPLSHLPGYEPTARGMAVGVRYADVFAPAHDVSSLWQLVERLRSTGVRSPSLGERQASG